MTTPWGLRTVFAAWLIAVIAMSGCAGKDSLAPTDVEKQAFDDLRTKIREIVDDADRETSALRLVDKLETDLAEVRSAIADRKRIIRDLNASYDTSRDEFEAHLDRIATDVRRNKEHVPVIHRDLLKILTADELDAIAKTHTSAMKAAIATIQAI